MDSIIAALQGIALLVIPAVGYLMWDVIKLWRARIAKQTKREEDEALDKTLRGSAVIAVKSTAQTVTAGKRDESGTLPLNVASDAKENARTTLKRMLTEEQLALVREQYGADDSKLDAALDPLLESALHDIKQKP